MSTINLPGGHRITGVPEPGVDFTPTFQEWAASLVNPNLSAMFYDHSGESAFYTGINFSILNAQLILRGTDSFTALRGMYIIRNTPQIMAASAARHLFEQHGALGPGSPADVHNRSATSSVNNLLRYLQLQLS